jgi:hypothetical protein
MYLQRNTEQEFIINLGDIQFQFGKLGINQITHPIAFTHSETQNISTDWISPYSAGTVTSGVTDGNHAAAGGNHGTDGAGGFATANSISTSVLLDGVEAAQDGLRKTIEKVEMTTVNYITNKANIDLITGVRSRNDIKETVKYTFENNHMQVQVELEALEDFYINWYLGLQATRGGFDGDIYFNHDLSNTALTAINELRVDSGTKAQSPSMERLTMRKGMDVMHVYIDKDYGVGYSKIRDTDPIAYLNQTTESNSGKLYFHLVKNGNQLIVPKGTKVSYRGGYIFGKNKAANATTVTYFTENGVKKALVDFKVIATENITFTSVEESFNCTVGTNSITSTAANAYAKIII